METITIKIEKTTEEITMLATEVGWKSDMVDDNDNPITAVDFFKTYLLDSLKFKAKEIKKRIGIKQVNIQVNQTPETGIEVV